MHVSATSQEVEGNTPRPLEIVLFVTRNAIRRASCLQRTRAHEEGSEFPRFARFAGVIQLISRNSGRRFLTRRLPLGSIASRVIHGSVLLLLS